MKAKQPPHATPADSTEAVDAFMATLDHPFKEEIEAIRRSILGTHAIILEGIKWNSPSFRTSEYFATINLRAKGGVGIVMHLGAKVRELPEGAIAIKDPDGLLKWLGKDRALVQFKDMKDFKARKVAFEKVVRQWIDHV